MGSDPIGAWLCERDPSQSCPPIRPAGYCRSDHEREPTVTTSMPAEELPSRIIVGVDTHKHVHVAVAIDTVGVRLGDRSFAADSGGYIQLAEWAEQLGRVEAFGIEGTGSYGAGLTSLLRRRGHRIVEVNRGNRQARRANGKSDTADAEIAARQVLAGVAKATPKFADGHVEMIRQLKVARDTAVKARTTAMITLKQVVVNAPAELRETLSVLSDKALVNAVPVSGSETSPTRPPRPNSACGPWPGVG